MLDLEIIKTFTLVAETSSFSQAAQQQNKTPAAISYRIKTLEDSIGIALFKRTTRSVSLTSAGEHLLERCYQWLVWLDEIPHELQQINDGVERQVNIVVNNLLYSPQAAAQLLAYLSRRYPFTQFNIARQVYMGVWDVMLNEDCQFAIGAPGKESLSDHIQTHPLGQINWVFVMAAAHPLATQTEPLTEKLLWQYPVVNVEDSSQHLQKRTAWRLRGQKQILVPDLQAKLQAHLKGVGVGFLPEPFCRPYLCTGELLSRQLANPRLPSHMKVAWDKNRCGKITRELAELFKTGADEIASFRRNLN